ncbi:hypothetical protein A3841_10805 [Pontibacter flavimaris]|uniref:Uncharacterized protein n=1 Tax=Pontibacter flavimaris TaxID=1797110 RepID=A0A1Q5PH21_9BACT|nr:hypothetical protein A3841_10805 [Pontibacter flavimaris]
MDFSLVMRLQCIDDLHRVALEFVSELALGAALILLHLRLWWTQINYNQRDCICLVVLIMSPPVL